MKVIEGGGIEEIFKGKGQLTCNVLSSFSSTRPHLTLVPNGRPDVRNSINTPALSRSLLTGDPEKRVPGEELEICLGLHSIRCMATSMKSTHPSRKLHHHVWRGIRTK